jgi:hypothetical protein
MVVGADWHVCVGERSGMHGQRGQAPHMRPVDLGACVRHTITSWLRHCEDKARKPG